MFDDLMESLSEEGLETFAYADDLAVADRGKVKLKKAIKVIEN